VIDPALEVDVLVLALAPAVLAKTRPIEATVGIAAL
jgi:hypothetical protein